MKLITEENIVRSEELTSDLQVAVLVPCYNEEATVGAVVRGFRAALPDATIYVYDNNSSDATIERAEEAGAIVRRETRQGKGYVVRRMFCDIEADIYIMVDGDDTYEAAAAPKLVRELVIHNYDMVNGARTPEAGQVAYRLGHEFGNQMLSGAARLAFGRGFKDMLSGYRVMSRRFVKSFPMSSTGFEIETELSVHAMDLEMPVAEIDTRFQDRPEGSTSKLNTIRDGIRISAMIVRLFQRERPLLFFGVIGLVLMAIATLLILPVLATYLQTGLVPRFPTLIAATGLAGAGLMSVFAGLILHNVVCGRVETKKLAYLAISGTRYLGALHV